MTKSKKRNYEQELIESVRALNRGEGRRFTVNVPEDIRALRSKIGLSQAEFALATGLNINRIKL